MRLEMVIEMQIAILNDGEILVNCNFKLNKNLNSTLDRQIPRNMIFSSLTSWSPFRISICNFLTVSSFIFQGTGCTRQQWNIFQIVNVEYWTPQPNVIYSLIRFFHVETHKVFTSIPRGTHVSLHKPWHEQVHSARSSCTAPERVRKRSEFGWK